MRFRFNEAQQWVQAASCREGMSLDFVGGFERPGYSIRAVQLLRREGLFTASEVRAWLAQAPVERGIAVAAWAYCAYLFELGEAWREMFWRAQALTDLSLEEGREPPLLEQALHVVEPGESIAAALKIARAGDRIRLMPGVYRERISIVTPVELEAAGEAIVDNPEGCAILVDASGAYCKGLELRAGASMHGAIVRGYFLALDGCDIAAGNFGVHVASERAHALLKDCAIHDCGGAGLVVHEGSLAMEGGLVSRSGVCNAQIEGASEARIERTVLERSPTGLIATGGASVSVSGGVFASNGAGANVLAASSLLLASCTVRGNSGGGAFAFGANAHLRIVDSQIFDNAVANVGADLGADALVSGSRIAGGDCAGWADHGATLCFERCSVGIGSEGVVREMNGGAVSLIDSRADVQPSA